LMGLIKQYDCCLFADEGAYNILRR
jgi:hypothetical protein